MKRIWQQFKLSWKSYLLQSLFSGLSIFILLVVLNLQNMVVVASIGATAFIVFTMPHNTTAQAPNVIGGHLVGFVCGSFCSFIPHSYSFPPALIYALAIAVSIFIMVVTDTEHPPAAGTALALTISGFSFQMFVPLFLTAAMLSLVHHLFKDHLKDLV